MSIISDPPQRVANEEQVGRSSEQPRQRSDQRVTEKSNCRH